MTKRKTDIKVVMLAIICITICEIIALCLGFNGQLLRWVLVIIAGLAGLSIPTPKILKR